MNEMQTQPYFIENSYKLLIVTLSITYFRRSGKAISYTVRKQENKTIKLVYIFAFHTDLSETSIEIYYSLSISSFS